MDSMLEAAARALAAGDPLGALKRVSLRDDPPALALRGTAMAQLGELPRARALLKQAARGFGPQEALSRARCDVAEAEVALALRELGAAPRPLAEAIALLHERRDLVNARHGQLVALRRLLLLGRLQEATRALDDFDTGLADAAATAVDPLPPALRAVAELVRAELALRGLRCAEGLAALRRAGTAASRSGVPALQAELAEAQEVLPGPRRAFCSRAARRRCRCTRWRPCWPARRWWWMPAATRCALAARCGRSHGGRCCSPCCWRWPKPGRAMPRAKT